MPTFHVTWEIDIDAATPEEAARKARANQQYPRPGYWCGVFGVTDDSGETTSVDLDEIDQTPHPKDL